MSFLAALLPQPCTCIPLILISDTHRLITIFNIFSFWLIWINVQCFPFRFVFILKFQFSFFCPLYFGLFEPSLLWADLCIIFIDLFISVKRCEISFYSPAVVFAPSDQFHLCLSHSFLSTIDYLLLFFSFLNCVDFGHHLFNLKFPLLPLIKHLTAFALCG